MLSTGQVNCIIFIGVLLAFCAFFFFLLSLTLDVIGPWFVFVFQYSFFFIHIDGNIKVLKMSFKFVIGLCGVDYFDENNKCTKNKTMK